MKRRSIMQAAIAAPLLLWRKTVDAVAGNHPTGGFSQWQWRGSQIGAEVEETLKRVVSRCDIGRGRGTLVQGPQRHNVFHLWVDEDDDMILAIKEKRGKVPPDFQSRCYVVSLPIQVVFEYHEDDLVKSLQKAMAVAKSQSHVRRWKELLLPDRYEGMVNLVDYLPRKEETEIWRVGEHGITL